MSDIFLSYAREDQAGAERLAGALAARGWSVWWDRRIVPGQHFDREIEAALAAARAVVVLWSPAAVASDWVRNEAGAAQDRQVLVPALIADCPLPLEFRRRQAAPLVDWAGEPGHAGFQALCDGLARLLDAPASSAGRPSASVAAALAPGPPVAAPAASVAPAGGRSGRRLVLGAVVLLALMAGLAARWSSQQAKPASTTAPAPLAGGASAGGAVVSTASGAGPATPPMADLAGRVAGRYAGDIIADSQGPSRGGVWLTLTRLDARTLRIDSDEPRLALPSVGLDLAEGKVLGNDAGTALVIDLAAQPLQLSYSPRLALSFSGRRQTP